jgi:GTP-binding protein HflX
LISSEKAPEKAILIGIHNSRPQKENVSFWAELDELARTAGATIVGTMIQPRDNPDPALFLGSGKAEELAQQVKELRADIVIAAQELSAVQVRNLSDLIGVNVIDRTGLILDIFAQRAQTREGKLQVELAQLNYFLPRIGNSDLRYSRMGGGIGTRGPGETKLEVDRRHLRQRIADLKQELLEVETHRMVQRQQREKNQIPTVALVGYTNAGKSTLFNRLTHATVSAEGRLFDTLDPVSHMVKLPDRREALILDTVGFISDLPHQLVAAFKATLEETIRATVLVQVMDASSPNLMEQYTAVRAVLTELKIATKETLNVLNKVDLLDSQNSVQRLAKEWEALPVSAKQDLGITELVAEIQRRLASTVTVCRVLLPFAEAGLLDLLHRKSRVLEEVFTEEGIRLLVELEAPLQYKLQPFMLLEE